MEVTMQAADLSVVINRMQGIAGTDSKNPIRSSILIRTEKDSAVLTAFDGQMGVVCTVPAVVHSIGSALLPFDTTVSKLLHSLRGTVKLGHVKLGQLAISAGQVEIKLWERGLPEDFPRLPVADVKLAPLQATNLLEMIRRTLHAADREGTRVALCGAFLEAYGEGHRMVTSDGKRLAMMERPLGAVPLPEKGVVIPLAALVKLQQLLENNVPEGWEMGTSEKALVASRPGLRFFASLADAEFPDYARLIDTTATSVHTPRERALEAVQRVSIICPGVGACVRLTVDSEGLRVEAESDMGTSRDFFEVHAGEEAHKQSHFSPRQVAELLVAAELDEVRVAIPGPESAAVFRTTEEDGFTAILMPIRTHRFKDSEPPPGQA